MATISFQIFCKCIKFLVPKCCHSFQSLHQYCIDIYLQYYKRIVCQIGLIVLLILRVCDDVIDIFQVNETWVLPALKQIQEICKLFNDPPASYGHQPQPSSSRIPHIYYKNHVINKLQNEHKIVMTVAQNLTQYMQHAKEYQKGNAVYCKVKLVMALSNTLILSRFCLYFYSEHVFNFFCFDSDQYPIMSYKRIIIWFM